MGSMKRLLLRSGTEGDGLRLQVRRLVKVFVIVQEKEDKGLHPGGGSAVGEEMVGFRNIQR